MTEPGNNDVDTNQIDVVQRPREHQPSLTRREIREGRVKRRLQLNSILNESDQFPLRQRTKIDVLVDRFLSDLKDDVQEMICDNDYENYRGLDNNRDTEDEVETVLRHFPCVLSQLVENECYPIHRICWLNDNGRWRCNAKAVSFVYLFAKIAIEFDRFEEHERGGLLVENRYGDNVLKLLVTTSDSTYGEDHNRTIDDSFTKQLNRLKRENLLLKDDIRDHDLIREICRDKDYFAERRIRFLFHWDPTLLVQYTKYYQRIPLHYPPLYHHLNGFRAIFECCMMYYPKRVGIRLLFQKDHFSDMRSTPFQYACRNFRHENVMGAVNDVLSSADVPIDTVDALISAAIDDDIHLDCTYLLLRREPDLLVTSLLPSPPKVTSAIINSNNETRHNNDSNEIYEMKGYCCIEHNASNENEDEKDAKLEKIRNVNGDDIPRIDQSISNEDNRKRKRDQS